MSTPSTTSTRLQERLEQGEILVFDPCPFDPASAVEGAFLRQQQLQATLHKNICYDPSTQEVTGFVRHSAEQSERLQAVMGEFSQRVTAWLAQLLPGYARSWQLDRASLRSEEEATRQLRWTARNDLLHFDAFPSRPARGQRILRVYVNISTTDDRVWITSDTLQNVLDRYRDALRALVQQPGGLIRRVRHTLDGLFGQPGTERRECDEFMLRLHHFLKFNDGFQEHSPRKIWHFKPRTAWVLFSDGVSHAELRGQHALEHSYFVPTDALALPDLAPVSLHARLFAGTSLSRAA